MKTYILPKYIIDRELILLGHYFLQFNFDIIESYRASMVSILTVNLVFTSGQEAFYNLSV